MCLKDKTRANLSTLDADVLTYDMPLTLNVTLNVKNENSAQTAFRLSPIQFCAPHYGCLVRLN